jgi:hypothetical protein
MIPLSVRDSSDILCPCKDTAESPAAGNALINPNLKVEKFKVAKFQIKEVKLSKNSHL